MSIHRILKLNCSLHTKSKPGIFSPTSYTNTGVACIWPRDDITPPFYVGYISFYMKRSGNYPQHGGCERRDPSCTSQYTTASYCIFAMLFAEINSTTVLNRLPGLLTRAYETSAQILRIKVRTSALVSAKDIETLNARIENRAVYCLGRLLM